ncbi:hypothetical protein [Pontibacter deserti]|nr:hypothetical protein [Pontibacter sp. KCTC 32443]
MKRLSTISSLLLLGTTFGFFMKGWLTSHDIHIDLSEEEVHMYL